MAQMTDDRRSYGREPYDVLCFSHLRWDFVFQRPQHLLSRCARTHRVFYVEEAVDDSAVPRLEVATSAQGVEVVKFHMPPGAEQADQAPLLQQLIDEYHISNFILWFYAPMALPLAAQLRPAAAVYDCMDEHSGFLGAPSGVATMEDTLMAAADVVFTGGRSLYEKRRDLHPNVHLFPSSVDVNHFGRARLNCADPSDQAALRNPRVGFFGVIDERMDLPLVDAIAKLRPDWEFVFVGPVVKINPESLPVARNIHYLGLKRYDELPEYIGHWDAAMLPFARNEATRFISPTKVPEYLAAGKPVISTSIEDVVRDYADSGLVQIADTPAPFVAAAERCMSSMSSASWLAAADERLSLSSWDATWSAMADLVEQAVGERDVQVGDKMEAGA